MTPEQSDEASVVGTLPGGRGAGLDWRQFLASLTTAPAARFDQSADKSGVSPGIAADLVVLGSDPAQGATGCADVQVTSATARSSTTPPRRRDAVTAHERERTSCSIDAARLQRRRAQNLTNRIKGRSRYMNHSRRFAVRDYLAAAGVAAGRMRTIGLGELRPVAPNINADGTDDEAGRQRNRRVEVILPTAEASTP
jgi:hypothetical protein